MLPAGWPIFGDLCQRWDFHYFRRLGMLTYSSHRINNILQESPPQGLDKILGKVANRVPAHSVFILHIFLSNVFLLENLDLTPLEDLQKEFGRTGDELADTKQNL